MKERPILFSGEMVRAILDGRKNQTRRVVKPAKDRNGSGCHLAPCEIAGEVNGGDYSLCPYGQPGDRLWVRETWGKVQMTHLMSPTPGRVEEALTYRAGRLVWKSEDRPESGSFDSWPVSWSDDHQPSDGRWRPSIHMPRWASRITLEIVSVSVERLKEISEADAEAEGVERHGDSWVDYLHRTDCHFAVNARTSFATLWDSINGRGSRDANPWVWVVEFKRVEQARAAA
ncbi:morphogenetic protein [Billgrantia antri]|uniref:Morphogenetic protein n=1 Tax=Halomonas sulfidivorans TaxID=2733488 RepID=A0ABX7WLA3_9GAMM|nr:hypothetical protein [Halomonas sulfidivorans]QTP60896.1 morphogenetic protein [Halomonas sulfidivorans]